MRKTLPTLFREPAVMSIIMLNGFALFMLAYQEPHKEGGVWFAIDYACIVFFVIEAMIKVRAWKWRGYLLSKWNLLDFIVVLMSLPFLLTPFLAIHTSGGVTVLRLLRLFRLFRLMRFIPDRDKIAAGIRRSLKASLGVFMGVLLVNLILAMGASMLFGDDAPQYFGTPLKAMYSMFQIFTVEGWYEMPKAIAASTDNELWAAFARIYFVGSVFGGGIIGLSLANAVFVDQMVSDNNDDVEVRIEELTQEVRKLRTLLEGRLVQPSDT